MAYNIREFDVRSLDGLIRDLKNARASYDNEEEAAMAAGFIFTWFGIIGGPAGVCLTASILMGALAHYYDTVQNTITRAIELSETKKDELQNDPRKDMVRMRVDYDSKTVGGITYLIPTNYVIIGIRINGVWSEAY